MHTGSFASLESVLDHYNEIELGINSNLDPRLRPAGNPQNLQMPQEEMNSVVAFMKKLTGSAIYSDTKWGNPFEGN